MFAGEAVSRLSGVPMGRGGREPTRRSTRARRVEAFRAMVRPRAATRASWTIPRASCRPHPIGDRSRPSGRARWRPSTPRRSGRASGELGAGRKKRETRSTRRWASSSCRRWATVWRPGRSSGRSTREPIAGAETCIRSVLAAITLRRSGRAAAARLRVARLVSDLKFALYLGISLVPALVLHEYAHAFVAVRLGDPTAEALGPAHPEPQAPDRPVRLADPAGARADPGRRARAPPAPGVRLREADASGPDVLQNPRRDMNLVVLAGLAREHRAGVPRWARDQGGRGDEGAQGRSRSPG